MDAKLYKASIPPVTTEFIQAMQNAFPNKIPKVDSTLPEIQRVAGQQEVIQWASNFMRNYDPTNPPIRNR